MIELEAIKILVEVEAGYYQYLAFFGTEEGWPELLQQAVDSYVESIEEKPIGDWIKEEIQARLFLQFASAEALIKALKEGAGHIWREHRIHD